MAEAASFPDPGMEDSMGRVDPIISVEKAEVYKFGSIIGALSRGDLEGAKHASRLLVNKVMGEAEETVKTDEFAQDRMVDEGGPVFD